MTKFPSGKDCRALQTASAAQLVESKHNKAKSERFKAKLAKRKRKR